MGRRLDLHRVRRRLARVAPRLESLQPHCAGPEFTRTRKRTPVLVLSAGEGRFQPRRCAFPRGPRRRGHRLASRDRDPVLGARESRLELQSVTTRSWNKAFSVAALLFASAMFGMACDPAAREVPQVSAGPKVAVDSALAEPVATTVESSAPDSLLITATRIGGFVLGVT